jgi:hypothetical protein
MKLREIVMLLGGMITLLAFIAYMFDFYQRTSQLDLIKKDIYYDSLVLKQQIELRRKDSVFHIYINRMDSLQNETVKKKLTKKEKETYQTKINEIKKVYE